MARFTNNYDIPVSAALWLLNDGYDHDAVADPNTYSVTELIKPLRQIILGRRVKNLPEKEQMPIDIMSLFDARLGQSIHESVENTWLSPKDRLRALLTLLEYNDDSADKVVVNPAKGEDTTGKYVLYMEQRRTVKLGKFFVTGQYDFNFVGQLEDFKITKTYAYSTELNSDYYALQGSCYRFLFPDQVTSNETQITFFFKDWQEARASTPNYPPNAIAHKKYLLKTIPATRAFLEDKLALIEKFRELPQKDLPECTDEELWKDPDTFKYYKKPDAARATKVFDSLEEANLRLAKDGGKGKVDTILGKVKACKYCAAFPMCTQKDKYLLTRQLEI